MKLHEPSTRNGVTDIILESNREMAKLLRAVYDKDYGDWVRVNDYGYLHYSKTEGKFYYAVKEKDINYQLFHHTSELIAKRAGADKGDIEWDDATAESLGIPGLRKTNLRLAIFKPKKKQ